MAPSKKSAKPAAPAPVAAAVQQAVSAETAESKAKFRANSIMRIEESGNPLVLRFVFNDSSLKPIEFDARKSPETNEAAMMHGYRQKIADAAALGKDSTPADKREAMQRVVDALLENRWNVEREAGTSLLVVAMADVYKKDVDTIRAWLASKSASERNALSAVKPVQDRIAEIRTERAKSAGLEDTANALLAEIDKL